MSSLLDFFGLGDVADAPTRGPDTVTSSQSSSSPPLGATSQISYGTPAPTPAPAASSNDTATGGWFSFPQQNIGDVLTLFDPFSGGNLTKDELAAVQAKTAADIRSTTWAQTADPKAVDAAVASANQAQAKATTVYDPTKLFAAGGLTLLAIIAVAGFWLFGGRR